MLHRVSQRGLKERARMRTRGKLMLYTASERESEREEEEEFIVSCHTAQEWNGDIRGIF